MTLEAVCDAWRTAGEKLGIRVEAPAWVTLQGESVECAAFLPDFGSEHGTAAIPLSQERLHGEQVDGDPFCSLLSDESYGQFDRELFVATLNDWGWFGDGYPPDWYEGTPWTQ
jgi:hypothetical protein